MIGLALILMALFFDSGKLYTLYRYCDFSDIDALYCLMLNGIIFLGVLLAVNNI